MLFRSAAGLVDALAAYPAPRLAVYSKRPDTLAARLAARGVVANNYSLQDALRHGQAERYTKARQARLRKKASKRS